MKKFSILVLMVAMLFSMVSSVHADPAYIDASTYGVSSASSDNTAALQAAVNAGLTYDVPVILPSGVLKVSGNIDVELHSVEAFEIYGQGASSTTLLRTDGSITADNQHMFSFKMPYTSEYIEYSTNNITIKMHDFTLDGNKRGNPFPVGNTNPNVWEHSADVTFLGYSGDGQISDVSVHDMTLVDPVADHFKFGGTGNSYVNNVHFYNLTSTNFDSTNTRADIYASGGMNFMEIYNSSLTAVEANFGAEFIDFSSPEANFKLSSNWDINNTTLARSLDIKGWNRTSVDMDGYPERSLSLQTHGMTTQKLHLDSTYADIYGGTVYLNDEVINRIDSVDAFFSGVTFKHKLNASGNITPLTFFAYSKNRVYLTNNQFQVDSASPTINPDGFALWIKPTGAPVYSMEYYLSGNVFDSRLKKNIDIDRADYVELSGNTFTGSDYAIRLNSNTSKPLTVVDMGGNTWPTTKYSILSSNGLTYTP